jgi:hypothetical protein
MNSNTAFPKLMARSYLSRSQPRTYRMATATKSTVAPRKTTSSICPSPSFEAISYAIRSNLRLSQSQNRMMASIANMSWPRRVPLSHGLALYAYSYLTSGRVEINSLNRCVTPTVQLS